MNSLEQTPLTEPQNTETVDETTEPITQEETVNNETTEPAVQEESAAEAVETAEPTVQEEPTTEEKAIEEEAPQIVDAEPAVQEEAPQTEETEPAVQEEEAPQAEEAEPVPADTGAVPLMMTKEEVLARALALVENNETSDKQELDLLKQLYYKYHNAEALAARQEYIDAGGDPNNFVPEVDPTEEQFKEAMQIIRQRRSNIQLALEKERRSNLEKKLAVIEKIKELSTTPEEANNSYEQFKALQNEWKEIGPVPAENVSEIWKNYHLYVEQFYDMLKLNSEMREYDFRKNLEAKVILCEQAEKLKDEADVIAAINRLQTLHQEWKEIGPIAKELREEMWNRFKEASTVIRKRHQEFFESRKAKEEENLQKKKALCEQAEAIDIEGLNTYSAWDAKTKEIIGIQAEWKTIGFAPQKHNNQIFERFRASCDKFFAAKAEFFKQAKENLSENLQKKTALCEKAESMMDSTDWKKATEAFVEMQKEWKTIGTVHRKVSDQLWKRFIGACDHFFEAKSKAHAEQRGEQLENLQKKQNIIQQMKELVEDTAQGAAQKMQELQEEWNTIGHVPLKEKDKIYGQYHDAVNALYKKLNISQAQRRLNSFRTTLKVTSEKGSNTLVRERERLMRAYDMMKNEVQTYENNLGFLSTNSKKGNDLVQKIESKIEKLKDELNLLVGKINAINEEMKNNTQE